MPLLSKDEKTVSLQMIEAGYPFVSFHKKKTLFGVFLLFLYFRFRDLFSYFRKFFIDYFPHFFFCFFVGMKAVRRKIFRHVFIHGKRRCRIDMGLRPYPAVHFVKFRFPVFCRRLVVIFPNPIRGDWRNVWKNMI